MKAFYALKQALSVWYKNLVKFLKKLRFVRVELDHGIFISKNKQLFISVNLDDLLFFDVDISRLEDIQQKLSDQFKMIDQGEISQYLEMEVDYVVGEKITLCQSIYLKRVLDVFKITRCKLATVFMNPRVANFLLQYNRNADRATIKWYQSDIESFMWPAVNTRPDIAYSVRVLRCYCSNPGRTHCNLVVQVFWYLSPTLGLRITFNANSENDLVSSTDSDYKRLVDCQKFTGGYIFLLSGRPLSYQSK